MPGIGSRRLLPRPTLRLRLTLLYGAVFLVAGAVLLGITYELVSHSGAATQRSVFFSARGLQLGDVPPQLVITNSGPLPRVLLRSGSVKSPTAPPGEVTIAPGAVAPSGTVQLQAFAGQVNARFHQLTQAQARALRDVTAKAQVALRSQQSAQNTALLTRSGIALGIMAILSIGLGWLVAGRTLRPMRTMTSRARGISERNLHERLALDGPDDELKELANTFDELLARLEAAFESQRRFVANASHELRTPVTLERTLVEVALADPHSTTDSLRDTCRRVLAATQQQEEMIDALLTLARSQRGLESRHPFDLAEIAAESLQTVHPDGILFESGLEPAVVQGDRTLLERLVGNLIDNALHYNLEDGGWVRISTSIRDGRPALEVSNTGPLVADGDVDGLTEPFRRLGAERTETRGAGLGLSIVAAIATAHGAELSVVPRAVGGLDVRVVFPAAPAAILSGDDVAVHA